jgi:two-component system, sensor histidine kinase PdtaS
MEHLLQILPPKPHSAGACMVATTVLVGLSFLLVLRLHQANGVLGFYVLFPAIFVVSILFDRGSGIYATALSTALLYAMLTPTGSILIPPEFILPLALFVAIAVGFAVISEGLRTAWDRAATAERAKDLLLQELGHRTKKW